MRPSDQGRLVPQARRRMMYWLVGWFLLLGSGAWMFWMAKNEVTGVAPYIIPFSILTLGAFFINPSTAGQWADAVLDRLPRFHKPAPAPDPPPVNPDDEEEHDGAGD